MDKVQRRMMVCNILGTGEVVQPGADWQPRCDLWGHGKDQVARVGAGENSRVYTTFQEVCTIITKVFEGLKVTEVQINIRTNPCCRQVDVHIIDDLIISV